MGGAGNTGVEPYTGAGPAAVAGGRSLPGWASDLGPSVGAPATAPAVQRPYEGQGASTGALVTTPSASGPGPVTSPENLGFPTGFNHSAYPTAVASTPTYAATAAPVAPTTTPTTPEAPKEGPLDWLYPGNLPMDFDERAGEFGKPRPYTATGPLHTAGYGAAGSFGGVTGYGPPQKGLEDKVLLPDMKAGTKLEGADIDQRNRVRREDYDRYMKLYGVGYDLPAYRNALNGLVYDQNMAGYGGTGGG